MGRPISIENVHTKTQKNIQKNSAQSNRLPFYNAKMDFRLQNKMQIANNKTSLSQKFGNSILTGQFEKKTFLPKGQNLNLLQRPNFPISAKNGINNFMSRKSVNLKPTEMFNKENRNLKFNGNLKFRNRQIDEDKTLGQFLQNSFLNSANQKNPSFSDF
ncbi:hypothetical protein MHBO_004037 [Bonamia ostreae]|uniref:Uncharacterized protein n=1 Tax=Bonamia ostreae TaxID=126728 RepID=A0ABV2AS75_9EUKA